MQCHKCQKELKDGLRSGPYGRYLCVDCFVDKWKVQPKEQLIIEFKKQLEFNLELREIIGGE